MPPGRPQRPLFEFLAPGSDLGRRQVAPLPVVVPPRPAAQPVPPVTPAVPEAASAPLAPEPKPYTLRFTPKPRPAAAGAPPRSESAPEPASFPDSSAEDDAPAGAPSRAVAIPVNGIYAGIAGVLVLLVITWAIAFRSGRAGGDAEWRPSGEQAAAPLPGRDPLTDPALRSQAPSSLSGAMSTPGASKPITLVLPQALSASGVAINDPRQKGLNYLHLALLPQDQALKAAAYLAKNGLEAVVVPAEGVDRPLSSAKNPPSWLVVTRGFSREQLRSEGKGQLEQQTAQLGKAWQKNERGGSDFSRPMWVKHQ